MIKNRAKRQIINLSIILFFILSFHSCRKDEGGVSVPNPFFYLNDLVADDITFTDLNGNIIFTIDSTDWTTLDIFSHSIGALFSFNDTINYNNVDTSTVTVYPAFPNPNSNPFNETLSIYYNSSQVTVLKFVVVDSAQNVVIRYAKKINPGVDNVQFLFNDPNAPPNSKYRILYRFYSAPNKYYKSGHGDILIN